MCERPCQCGKVTPEIVVKPMSADRDGAVLDVIHLCDQVDTLYSAMRSSGQWSGLIGELRESADQCRRRMTKLQEATNATR